MGQALSSRRTHQGRKFTRKESTQSRSSSVTFSELSSRLPHPLRGSLFAGSFAARYPKHAEYMGVSEQETSLPLLYSLARAWAWGAVGYRCQTHPDEATAVDQYGDTVLHWACFGNCPIETVEHILLAHPESPLTRNHRGQTPLHVACSYRASSDVIRLLLQRCPEVAAFTTRTTGSTPLHLLMSNHPHCSPEIVLLLLQAHPAASTQTETVNCWRPLQTWHNRQNGTISFQQRRDALRLMRRKRVQGFSIDQDLTAKATSAIDSAVAASDYWRKAALLILAEMNYPLVNESAMTAHTNPAVLFAAVSNPCCPAEVQEMAVLIHYHHLDTPNADGELPLHAACGAHCGSAIQHLIEYAPFTARITNRQGQLPLQLLVKHETVSWFDGLGSLVQAWPAALHQIESLPSGCIPEIWSRLSSDALYAALQSSPEIWRRSCV